MHHAILAADHLQVLRRLAGSPNGCTEALLAAHGVSIETMVALVRAGHVTARGSTSLDREGAERR